jgi:hypothetical protein
MNRGPREALGGLAAQMPASCSIFECLQWPIAFSYSPGNSVESSS